MTKNGPEPQERSQKEIIEAAVRACFEEMIMSGALKNNKDIAYKKTSKMLHSYFSEGPDPELPEDKLLESALINVRNDPYFGIIENYYRDGKTIEEISELRGVDPSTITRNKKRLCLLIYSFMQRG